MFRILIADFVVEIHNRYNFLKKLCTDYIYEGERPSDFVICVTDAEIEEERRNSESIFTNYYTESVCAYRKLCLKLPEYGAFLVHGSTVSYKDKGIIFLARSGVGKTTHTLAWKNVYGDDVLIINGDKPIVRFIDGEPFAYGTPWAGKEKMQFNSKVKLTDICFIERDSDNSTVKINSSERLNSFMQQILPPNDPLQAIKTLELVDKLVGNCNNWLIKCTPTDQAAIVAHDAICNDH